MKIAVTGHLGTIGQPLVRALREQGHEVTGIDIRHHVDGVRADVADYRQLARALPLDVDLVYHLAAEFGRHNGEDFYEQVWRSNTIGTKNVLRIQKERGFKLIFASSSEVYGERDDPVLHEALPLSPLMLTNDYAISKLVNEAQIANARKQWGAQAMVLRFCNVYGPGEFYSNYRSVVCLFIYRALHGMPYDVYDGRRVFQYIDDMIATLSRAATHFIDGETINLAGNEYRSIAELSDEISKHIPTQPVMHSLEPFNVTNKLPSIEKAQRLLGHDPKTTLADGIGKTVEWMRSVYRV